MSEQQAGWAAIGGCPNKGLLQQDKPVSVSLSRAMLCVDCDRIFEATRDGRCPLCGSRAVVPVGRWINSMPATRPGIAG